MIDRVRSICSIVSSIWPTLDTIFSLLITNFKMLDDDDDDDDDLYQRLKDRIVPVSASATASPELPNQAEFVAVQRQLPRPIHASSLTTTASTEHTNFMRMTLQRCLSMNKLPHQLIPLAKIPEETYDYDTLTPLSIEELKSLASTPAPAPHSLGDDDDDDFLMDDELSSSIGDNTRAKSPGADYDHLYTDPKRPQFNARVHEHMINMDSSGDRAAILIKAAKTHERAESEQFKRSQMDDKYHERQYIKAYKKYCKDLLNPVTFDQFYAESGPEP